MAFRSSRCARTIDWAAPPTVPIDHYPSGPFLCRTYSAVMIAIQESEDAFVSCLTLTVCEDFYFRIRSRKGLKVSRDSHFTMHSIIRVNSSSHKSDHNRAR